VIYVMMPPVGVMGKRLAAIIFGSLKKSMVKTQI